MTNLDDESRRRIGRLGADALERLEREPERADGIELIDAALGRIRRSMARQSLGRRVLADLGADIDPSLVEVLHAIAGGSANSPDVVSIGVVAQEMGVDPSQASRLVREAVAAGLVGRVASPDDARRSALQLTELGAALVASSRNYKHALLLEHFRDWSEQDLSDFARLLTRFSSIARPDGRS
ncbi:MarR family winged helix-turn-helix transcriptional regulator [Kaistia granuli]|uniref:MarR family winged helix-turn-helix transcriptional regulator n=1 Tax=Kaistia granuli TaxID=363259 RepID=UPI00039B750B|nr:MarR family transcriptional regulator [Kaistia granuli]